MAFRRDDARHGCPHPRTVARGFRGAESVRGVHQCLARKQGGRLRSQGGPTGVGVGSRVVSHRTGPCPQLGGAAMYAHRTGRARSHPAGTLMRACPLF